MGFFYLEQMAIQYVGPYSPEVYAQADFLRGGPMPEQGPVYTEAIGDVLSAQPGAINQSTSTAPAPAPTPTSGPAPASSGPSPEEQARIDAENRLRGDINTGWDTYIGELDAMLNEGLPGQKTAQEDIARGTAATGIENLGIQKAEGEHLLTGQEGKTQKNQAKTLRDLASNLRNMFMAGNVMLGARGAGDSSAADQYSYALTKLGTRARTDVMNKSADIMSEIQDRRFKLENIFNTEKNKLELAMNNQISQIATWFNEQQNQIRMAQAEGGLGRSRDLQSLSQQILDRATRALDAAQQESKDKRAALDSWAMSNSENIQQLVSNMQDVGSFSPTQPQAGQIAGSPSVDSAGNFRLPATGYGSPEEDRGIFG